MDKVSSYDLIIVGIGPAGLTASIYASRYKLTNLVIGKQLGGELSLAHKIENYPGFKTISGLELSQTIGEQVTYLGAKLVYDDVGKIEIEENNNKRLFKVHTTSQEVFSARAVIVATGSERRRLGVPGESELVGKGVSYCSTCDAPFYKGKVVGVIGGSDSAVTGAIHVAEFAQKAYLIYRGEKLRAEPIWLEELKGLIDQKKVEVIYQTNVSKILTKAQIDNSLPKTNEASLQLVGGVELDKAYNGQTKLVLNGVFIEIGGVPGTSLVKPLGVNLSETGHVKVNEDMTTNVTGLYCAGDMVDKSLILQQAITGMAQGAVAAASAYKFLKGSQAPRILGI